MTALDTTRLHHQPLNGDLLDTPPAVRRPVLTAMWQVDSDGRLGCRWHMSQDTGDPGTERLLR